MSQASEIDPAAPPSVVTLSGGAALARVLRASGVVDLFGVPAGKLTPFLGPVAADPAFRHLGTRHEASAVWMAGALFQATGRIAVAYGESGPGSHNLVSALGSLRNNNLAALVLTPGAPSGVAYPHQGLVMDSDNERLFAPVTAWSGVARSAERIPQLVRWALREALTGRPGPTHLEIPIDVLRAEATFDPAELDAPLERFLPSGRAPADRAGQAMIRARDLTKHFRVHKRPPGFASALRSLIHRRYELVKAVENRTDAIRHHRHNLVVPFLQVL